MVIINPKFGVYMIYIFTKEKGGSLPCYPQVNLSKDALHFSTFWEARDTPEINSPILKHHSRKEPRNPQSSQIVQPSNSPVSPHIHDFKGCNMTEIEIRTSGPDVSIHLAFVS